MNNATPCDVYDSHRLTDELPSTACGCEETCTPGPAVSVCSTEYLDRANNTQVATINCQLPVALKTPIPSSQPFGYLPNAANVAKWYRKSVNARL
jgi:hypothetical protein